MLQFKSTENKYKLNFLKTFIESTSSIESNKEAREIAAKEIIDAPYKSRKINLSI